MQRAPRRRLLAAMLASMTLLAVAIPPIAGGASAASTSTSCSNPESVLRLCNLVIVASQSVLTGAPFSVQVLVTTDGTTVAKGDACAATVPVILDLSQSNGDGGFFEPSSLTVNAVGGIATFSLTVSADDLYRLEAKVITEAGVCAGYGWAWDTLDFNAVTVPPTQPIAPCPDNVTCVQTFGGSGTAATLIADTGTFDPLFGGDYWSTFVDSGLTQCGGPPADPERGVLGFTFTQSDSANPVPKTIVFALSSALVTKGIGLYNICWHSDTPFTPLGGGASVYEGLLPDCKKGDVGPCVLFRRSNQRNVGFFGALAPELDPKATVR